MIAGSRQYLLGCAIALNALVSGGIFTFPLISPALAFHLKLTQPQLTTIVLAGMMGQYPLAAVVGQVIDHYGPWLSSLISATLFSSGFGLFALEIAKTPEDISASSHSSFRRLTLFFFLCGMGTVFGLFSALFAATKAFPRFIGLASGATMSLFGLSPLFISLLASAFFTDPQTGLDVTAFMSFLSIATGIVLLFSSFVFTVTCRTDPPPFVSIESPPPNLAPSSTDSNSGAVEPSERDTLLARNVSRDSEGIKSSADDPSQSVLGLFRDLNFWLLACAIFVVTGIGETIMTNIGSIILSLSPPTPGFSLHLERSADAAISTQVQVISISNTLARLIVGTAADLVSPVAVDVLNNSRLRAQRPAVSRMVFLTSAALLSVVAHVWLGSFVRSPEGFWLLSVCTGISYGSTFVILPSILSGVWGAKNLGRNYGLITYASFVGTPCFSYLYAFVSEHYKQGRDVCIGVECWKATAWAMVGASMLATAIYGVLWRRWKGLC